MTERDTVRSKSAALAVRLHFLFEALRLDLLPRPLAQSVGRLAAAAEEGGGVGRQVRETGAAFLDHREGMGLGDLAWPRTGGEVEGSAAAGALSRCEGEAAHRAAAERLGRFCEEVVHQGRGRKSSGSYYTPGWIADEIASTMVAGVLAGRREREALALRVLDPAVGAGAFALAAVEAIAVAAGEGPDENAARREAARRCVFGMEVNRLAAEVCRLAVWLGASRPGRPAAMPAGSIAVGDALLQTPRPRSFDLVVGNPPWGVRLPAGRAGRLARAAPEALSGHRDSYLFFLNMAAEWAAEEGGVGMLLPDVLLWQARYEGMRRRLLARFRLLKVALLGDRIFPGATAPACALCLVGREVAPRRYVTVDARRAPRAELRRAIAAAGNTAESESPVESAQASFVVAPEWLRRLLGRLVAQLPTLGEMGEVFQFHDAGINYPRAEVGRALLYSGEQEDKRDIAVTRGRDFGAFSGIGHSAWLRHGWREVAEREAGVSVREQVYRRAPKMLFRQTADRPVATLDRKGVWFGRSVIAVAAAKERDLLRLTAVFNSRAFGALYRAVAPESGRPFAQVKVNKLKLLPVPSEEGGEELVGLARAMLREREAARREALLAGIEEAVGREYGMSEREMARVEEAVRPASVVIRGAGCRSARRGRRGGTW